MISSFTSIELTGGGHTFEILAYTNVYVTSATIGASWRGSEYWMRFSYRVWVQNRLWGNNAGTKFAGRVESGDLIQDMNPLVGTQAIHTFSSHRNWWENMTDGEQSATSDGGMSAGIFMDGDHAYVALALTSELGEIYWGWLEMHFVGQMRIDSWAFEDSGEGIIAGEIPGPATVGIFALASGAAGLRRKRRA